MLAETKTRIQSLGGVPVPQPLDDGRILDAADASDPMPDYGASGLPADEYPYAGREPEVAAILDDLANAEYDDLRAQLADARADADDLRKQLAERDWTPEQFRAWAADHMAGVPVRVFDSGFTYCNFPANHAAADGCVRSVEGVAFWRGGLKTYRAPTLRALSVVLAAELLARRPRLDVVA